MADPVGRLPALREDLRLLPAASAPDGSPIWTLYDPAAHRFLRIGWMEFEILARWELGDAAAIVEAITRETPIVVTLADLDEMLRFVARAGLLRPQGEEASRQLVEQVRTGKLSPQRWLLKNYLFLRLTLFDPDRLLAALLPRVSWAFRPWFPMTLAVAAVLALVQIGRRWDTFTHGLSYAFSPEGALATGLALSFAKMVHEFGHGLAAKRFGCRVPAMGVAFLVLWPVLWTDVTDSWKLCERRQRLIIDAAGMAAEILLAVVASLVWIFLPDGPLRSATFLLAGSTWLLTLAVNLNPLMRFDGYFLLSDWLDIANLQDRSFAMGRWWLREQLFGLRAPPPETMALTRQRIVVGYALAVWVYRFFLFLGIALLVYHLAFKLLGMFLMAVEVWWFIARPILSELADWRARRGDMRWNRRTIRATTAVVALLLLGLVPWQGHVAGPGVLRAGRQVVLAAAHPGRLTKLSSEGAHLTEGQTAFTLDSPDLVNRRAVAMAIATGQRARLSGISFGEEGAGIEVSWQEFQRSIAEVEAVDSESDSLLVRAPFAGILVDLSPALRPGLWIAKHERLGMLIDPSAVLVEAFIAEADIDRVRAGASAHFIPEDGGPTIALAVVSVDAAAVRELEVSELASMHGGAIGVRQDPSRHLVPETSLYRVTLAPVPIGLPVRHSLRGVVRIAAGRVSMAASVWRSVVAAVVRESGL